MSSVLFLATTIQKDRSTWAKSVLLNSERVATFTKDQQYPLTRTQMFYVGEGNKTTEFLLSGYVNTIATRMGGEDETNRVVKLHVISYKTTGREKVTSSNQKIWEIGTDRIVIGWNSSATQMVLIVDRGDNNFVRLTCSHQVSDVSRAVSTSASLSKS